MIPSEESYNHLLALRDQAALGQPSSTEPWLAGELQEIEALIGGRGESLGRALAKRKNFFVVGPVRRGR